MNKDLMRQAGFGKAVDAMEAGLCPSCGRKIHTKDFRDALSKREYKISGLCQTCQDTVFGKGVVSLE